MLFNIPCYDLQGNDIFLDFWLFGRLRNRYVDRLILACNGD